MKVLLRGSGRKSWHVRRWEKGRNVRKNERNEMSQRRPEKGREGEEEVVEMRRNGEGDWKREA